MAKNVTIYSRNQCASCHMVKTWLKSKGVPFNEINLDEHPELTQHVIDLSHAMTVPVIVVQDGLADDEEPPKKVIVGWQPGQIASALVG